jgi:hypothetical protein
VQFPLNLGSARGLLCYEGKFPLSSWLRVDFGQKPLPRCVQWIVARCCKALPCTTLGIEDKMKRLIASFIVLSVASVWALSQTQVGVPAADAGHSSTIVSATAFRGSHSTGRSQSRPSSHRAKASGIPRNRHGRIRRSSAAKHSFGEEASVPFPQAGRADAAPAMWSIMSSRWSAAEPTPRATCNGRQ